MAGSDPRVKTAISRRILEISKDGDLPLNDLNELINILGLYGEGMSRTRVKRGLGSLIYGTGHIEIYHDQEAQRHFRLRRPYVPSGV